MSTEENHDTELLEPQTVEEPTTGPITGPATSWHQVHIAHLVMGLAFLGLVVVWALVVPLNAVQLTHARWLLPLPWLIAGAAGLIATIVGGRRRP